MKNNELCKFLFLLVGSIGAVGFGLYLIFDKKRKNTNRYLDLPRIGSGHEEPGTSNSHENIDNDEPQTGLRQTNIPCNAGKGTLLETSWFSICQDLETKMPYFTLHEVTSTGEAPPKGSHPFKPDHYVLEAEEIYRESIGIDVSHLVPAADAKTREERRDTYFYADTIPMPTKLNRGAWSRIEQAIRKYSAKEKQLIVTVALGESDRLNSNSSSYISQPEFVAKFMINETNKTGVFFIARNYGSNITNTDVPFESNCKELNLFKSANAKTYECVFCATLSQGNNFLESFGLNLPENLTDFEEYKLPAPLLQPAAKRRKH